MDYFKHIGIIIFLNYYQNSRNTSVKHSMQINAAKTIQYIIHLTYVQKNYKGKSISKQLKYEIMV